MKFQKETLEDLEDLVQCVSDIVDSGRNYRVKVNGRILRNARASVWDFMRSGRRTIEFSAAFLRAWEENVLSTNKVILTIIHEIAHFKDAVKFRRIALKNRSPSLTVGVSIGAKQAIHKARGHHWHGKKFHALEQKLRQQVECEYKEDLGVI